jgi:nucleoporin POM152
MSPISTAHLNPHAHTFCLSPHTGNTVLIPILLNNTEVANVRYTVTPLGYVEGESSGGVGKVEYVELVAKDLKAIEATRLESLQVSRPVGNGNSNSKGDVDEYDEYDDDEDDDDTYTDSGSHPTLQKTQSIAHIRLKKPGIVRLERVLDTSNIAARLSHPLEVIVVPCPTAEFVPDKLEPVRCAGQASNTDSETGTDLRFTIDIRGVPPLSLRWFREVNGKREYFLVEGIEGAHRDHHNRQQQQDGADASELPLVVNGRKKSRVSRELKVPLEVSLDAVGRHTYVLEEVIDGVGNAVAVEHPHTLAYKPGLGLGHAYDTNATLHTNSKTTRSLSVLRRPTISFKNCGPGSPTSLLIGSEAPLTISATEADVLDAPWEVSVKYQPPAAELDLVSGSGSKRFKSWKKNLTTQKENKELTLRASAPGEYTIMRVKGKVSIGSCWLVQDC